MFEFSKYDTRVRRCRHSVTAWFGEAEPKILWRAGKPDVKGVFWLRRHGNGWTEIVKRDFSGAEMTLASFPNTAAAEDALAHLQKALSGSRYKFWRALLWILAAIGLFFIALNAYTFMLVHRQAVAAQNAAYAHPSNGLAQQTILPQQAVPAGPIPGTPMDADSILH